MREIAPVSVSFVALESRCMSTVALACRREAGQLARHFTGAMWQ